LKVKLSHTSVIACLESSDKKKSCSILEHLLIQNKEIVAADGFMLTITKPESIELESGEDENTQITVPVERLKTLTKGLEDKSVEITIKAGETTGEIYCPLNKLSTKFSTCNGTYPNYKMLIPKENREYYIAVSSKLIETLGKIAKEQDTEVVGLRFRGRAAAVEFCCGKLQGALMPMFANEDSLNWHNEKS